MARVIASTQLANGKTVDVTPEAINQFSVDPTEIHWHMGNHSVFKRTLKIEIQANVKAEAPIVLTATESTENRSAAKELNEEAFAKAMIETIVEKKDNIDDIPMLQEAIKAAASDIATQIWQKTGAIYGGARIEGFGFIETKNEVFSVCDCILCGSEGNLYASGCMDLNFCEGQHLRRLHFLPKGANYFLLFQVDNANRQALDTIPILAMRWPEPSNEVSVGNVPGSFREYDSEDSYMEAVTKYLQAHMSTGNDKRVELEDDLIF